MSGGVWQRISMEPDRLSTLPFQGTNGICQRFLDTCRIKGSGVKNKITNGDKALEFVAKWNLFVPKDLGNMIAKGTEYGHEVIY